ncbi:MAG: DUF45 domain-containing protein [Oscillospiraceae bacterium]|nr:DUF45 domain-containing protein [Oscillospiraceae bacterium]
MDYKTVKDNRRKRMVMTVENDGTVVIKVPKYTRKAAIDSFYRANLGWIAQRRQTLAENSANIKVLSSRDISELKKQAYTVMSRKTAYYGQIMGLQPDKIKITSAKKRWGSCIKNKDRYTVCYSFRTMFLSDRVQDYIAVHELAHMVHFDHSKDFYSLVGKILPDWRLLSAQADNFKDWHIY